MPLMNAPTALATMPEILIASSNPEVREAVMRSLSGSLWRPQEARGGAEALEKLDQRNCELLLLDRCLPDLDAEELKATVQARFPAVEVLLLEAAGAWPRIGQAEIGLHPALRLLADPRAAAAALKPQDPVQVMELVGEEPEPDEDRETLPPPVEPLPGMIGSSPRMQRVYDMVRRVAARDTAVLLTGETGTGKELVALALHSMSRRSARAFVVINCAAIPESLLEAELFGYVRGAFTGAVQSRLGRIHAAQGGTLFLDEVGELPLAMQAKLLRFLEQGEVQRLGSPDLFRVDVRVVAATNAHLADRVAAGQFRQDLYYRLSVFPIELPRLAERRGDLAPLTRHFVQRYSPEVEKRLTAAAAARLEQHSWPGNVRELAHVVERACILSGEDGRIGVEHLLFSAEPRRGLAASEKTSSEKS